MQNTYLQHLLENRNRKLLTDTFNVRQALGAYIEVKVNFLLLTFIRTMASR